MEIVKISLADLQQAFEVVLWTLFPLAAVIGFMLGFMFHDLICHYLDVFFRWLRRRQFRNKERAYRGH